jgi:hypothetical protein
MLPLMGVAVSRKPESVLSAVSVEEVVARQKSPSRPGGSINQRLNWYKIVGCHGIHRCG